MRIVCDCVCACTLHEHIRAQFTSLHSNKYYNNSTLGSASRIKDEINANQSVHICNHTHTNVQHRSLYLFEQRSVYQLFIVSVNKIEWNRNMRENKKNNNNRKQYKMWLVNKRSQGYYQCQWNKYECSMCVRVYNPNTDGMKVHSHFRSENRLYNIDIQTTSSTTTTI